MKEQNLFMKDGLKIMKWIGIKMLMVHLLLFILIKILEKIKIVNDLLSTIPIYQKSDKSFTISSHINIIQSINSDFN